MSSNELVYGIVSTFALLLVVALFLAFARWVRVNLRALDKRPTRTGTGSCTADADADDNTDRT